jgi:hypothetical protein
MLTIRAGSEEDQLVQAAKEEAAAAMQLAQEADVLAKKITGNHFNIFTCIHYLIYRSS